ncbi:class A beta-lactamase [Isoptericola croceus]|uniref:class A beta-lactamase n=1 Tax=Isoptericola croceus TaxID=3031406 RepID=UPI0023FA239A|nr:class A beta-lactamase [Isoptericola croceus]
MRRTARPVLAALAVLGLAACTGNPGPTSTSSAPASPPTEPPPSATSTPAPTSDVDAALVALEAEFDARVGVAALDTGDGSRTEHRAHERWGYASTVKVFLAAELLRTTTAEQRTEQVTWSQEDVDAAGHAPVTGEHVGNALTLDQLAEAAVRESDNAATNILFDRIGGPSGLRDAFELIGDTTTAPARTEPALNQVGPGSTEDTTTPAAFTADLDALLHGGALGPADAAQLVEWMTGNATGDSLVRAGAPDGWSVADKSGGAGAIRNDVALVTPPGREPVLLTVLTERLDPDAGYEDELVERVAAVVLDEFR